MSNSSPFPYHRVVLLVKKTRRVAGGMTAAALLLATLTVAPASAAPSAAAGPSAAPATVSLAEAVAAAKPRKPRTKPRKPAPKPAPQPEPRPEVTFEVATLNVLGSSHTSRPRSSYASGPRRVAYLLQLLGSRGIDVAGLQEFQPDQRAEFARRADGWAQWPGGTKWDTGTTSIVWRTDQWSFVEGKLAPIPFYDMTRQSPSVLLENKKKNVRVWFSSFHNPADTGRFPRQQGNRVAATNVQAAVVKDNARTGVPQFLMGDMNERSTYYCRITSLVQMVSPLGGTPGPRCRAPKTQAIDWLLSSTMIDWKSYTVVNDSLVKRTTDHALRYGTVTVDTEDYPRAYAG